MQHPMADYRANYFIFILHVHPCSLFVALIIGSWVENYLLHCQHYTQIFLCMEHSDAVN